MNVVGREPVVALFEQHPSSTPWFHAARAFAHGDLDRSLAMYREMGSQPDVSLR
jgi:hypothetical protein